MALISVILTTLNSERYIARSIESCLRQTHGDMELIVVDGGSQDRTMEIVAGFADPRLRVAHQADNGGKLPGAINLGMAEARGEYITWTQDDCFYEPNALHAMLALLEDRPEVGLVYADYWDVDATGRRLRYQRVHSPEDILTDDVIRVCFLLRRAVYETIGPQETKYHPVHEPIWRIKVARRFAICPLHVALMSYTVHEHSLTGRIGGWGLQRMTAAALHAEGHLSGPAYHKALARTDIAQAYEACILDGSYWSLWRHALPGMGRDPGWFGNRGLLKLMLRSLLPGRESYRQKLAAQWRQRDEIEQKTLAAQASDTNGASCHREPTQA